MNTMTDFSALAPREEVTSAEAPSVVTFAAGQMLYALPVERVQEILDLRPIAPLPNAPAHLLGLCDVRGAGVPVVDLRSLLGLPPTEDTGHSRILVTWIGGAEERHVVGIKTERVIEVTTLDEGRMQHMSSADMLNWTDTAVLGIGKRNGAFVTLLDIDRLMDPSRLTVFAEARQGLV
ncbi:chemotaxis protein CheW [Cereibacter azotoformans]|uniref:Purine-binding chemotaxis protein CheW n=2 Tax=Cereibacter TaxID=1653176 RepID=A0A2T5KEQ7_9RHOB|nr:chemotaxis protein CheW [Cereibacter azotoformans]AXQ92540.1 chemotaxis protein CheW [Cereibacter sphaeroides]MBO4169882.1 chemotaxis protein CheW [Cereibacter azotoformans]PTR20856.1 purine-binding chemotaxis protein CheW [Cereibacter azotoformans]UIJ30815.1 chemotaxis protein CheW [Cereibacter azotoformans]ULB08577.1 chemotaxis protein CheW [Cereibacter azotoformans]